MHDEVPVVRRLFDAVERRDRDELLACYAENVENTEAQVLAYGGTYRGHDGELAQRSVQRRRFDWAEVPLIRCVDRRVGHPYQM